MSKKKTKTPTYEELEDRFAALSNKPLPSVLRQQRRESNRRTLAARKVKSTEHQRRLEAIRQEAYDRYAKSKPKRRIPPGVPMAPVLSPAAAAAAVGPGGGESKSSATPSNIPVARPMVRAQLAEVPAHPLLGRRTEEYTTKYKAWKKALESNEGRRNDIIDKLHEELRQIEKDAKIPVQGRQFRTSLFGTRKWRNLNTRDPENPRQRPRIKEYSQGRIRGGRRTRRRRKRKTRKHYKKKRTRRRKPKKRHRRTRRR